VRTREDVDKEITKMINEWDKRDKFVNNSRFKKNIDSVVGIESKIDAFGNNKNSISIFYVFGGIDYSIHKEIDYYNICYNRYSLYIIEKDKPTIYYKTFFFSKLKKQLLKNLLKNNNYTSDIRFRKQKLKRILHENKKWFCK